MAMPYRRSRAAAPCAVCPRGRPRCRRLTFSVNMFTNINQGAWIVKIVIPGGSGQVGTVLARAFHGAGQEVVVLSRHPGARPWRVVAWDGASGGPWTREIDGSDVVINLTGRSVNCRYNAANRKEILD